ncbi:MAG: acyl-CoA thioesterase [Bdellovibrionales bacterium CG10_big_fil_rev_8_21_14_0_10_45_34]|nr:MAG: acyl-CoA thioesterase [Bdellovibrionales bacterium CG10_big_fil_rev_8_21_14_0_10_45_34]
MFQHRYEITILEKHLDGYGHVNNAVYLTLLEEARWDLITSRGYSYDRVQKEKIGPVILAVQLQFKKELTLRNRYTIVTTCKDHRKRIGFVSQKIVDLEGIVFTEAEFTFGLFDLQKRKLIEPTSDWLYAIGWQDR